ncbi:hypothetical protein MLD38_033466 [Melastoma candidum]|uniref:Uncharacterized protein n=1 Tax=Melastoma candidum TaxID=119954 RepID=A0ACB9M7B6_9MYRT|nr:hypothetical protein MLD38_033466 [Melastoma candidum]
MSRYSLRPSDLPLLQERQLPSSLLLGRVLSSGYSPRKMPSLPVGCFCRNGRIHTVSDGTPVRSVMPDIARDYQTFPVPLIPKPEADPKTVVSIILGGGAGSRLFPLTKTRAKPAVSIGGGYRLIDFPVSNCIHSGINKIYILTQYNSQSLNRHIARTYNLGSGMNFGDGYIEVLAATQTPGESGMKWFQGTADAVRHFLWLLEDVEHKQIENILILSGDHFYQMDYMDFLQKHIDSSAGISISCVPIDERASDFELVKMDELGRITQILKKPPGEDLRLMQFDPTCLRLPSGDTTRFQYAASMGIYLFKADVLIKLLRDYPTANDFGSEVIPRAAEDHHIRAYMFDGCWEDIGDVRSFFNANLALTEEPSKFQFYDPQKPIFTSPRCLPPTRIEKCQVVDSIISDGCFLRECSIQHSILGIHSRLECGVEMKDTVMMGADNYQDKEEREALLAEGRVPIGVGRGTKIMNCIIDMNARIGKNAVITNRDGVTEADRPSEGFYIRSGITVILKDAVIDDGTII